MKLQPSQTYMIQLIRWVSSPNFLQMKYFIITAVLLSAVSLSTFACMAENRSARIHRKVDVVKQKAEEWVSNGRNPSQALLLMKAASQAFDKGDADNGESLVDNALQILGQVGNGHVSPASGRKSNEAVSNLYADPQRVEIVGYNEDAMEPAVSLDGQYLFFNGSNAGDVEMHISYAKRMSANRFQYLGLLPGARSQHRDMAPSMDSRNDMFFTTDRSFGLDAKTVYFGSFKQSEVTKVSSANGSVSRGCGFIDGGKQFVINMDCGISPDGNTLFVARAQFDRSIGGDAPQRSDLMMATRDSTGQFNIGPESELILRSVNTPGLEYAPTISADGLELYFTRAMSAQQLNAGASDQSWVSIMVAKRTSVDKPFGKPERLAAIEGFVEAPTITLDKREMFYHKKDGGLFRIYRAKRSD